MSPRAAEEQMEQLMKEMSTWQSRKRKAMILVRELYEEFLAYRTVKVVKLNDWRLGLLKRVRIYQPYDSHNVSRLGLLVQEKKYQNAAPVIHQTWDKYD